MKPFFSPKRLVTYATIAAVNKELYCLQLTAVIQPANYSLLAAPIVVIKKSIAEYAYVQIIPLDLTRRSIHISIHY